MEFARLRGLNLPSGVRRRITRGGGVSGGDESDSAVISDEPAELAEHGTGPCVGGVDGCGTSSGTGSLSICEMGSETDVWSLSPWQSLELSDEFMEQRKNCRFCWGACQFVISVGGWAERVWLGNFILSNN
ncbi:hypothetical protein OGATHE_002007 [Ogataea polymorpha]|uniref:Uncharacterized protein n=1 Tax=Ogataea polymorpha TaxID=460523 RepID=A0A9P8PL23_9ASCO|nr:hypothetical protein OGATHE_002007 [Ogataea polymorpha]